MRQFALLTLLAAVTILSACGFRLRGSFDTPLPFETLHIAQPETSELHAALKRSIEATGKTRIVKEAKDAQAVLSVLGDSQQKNILSLSAAGRVREFQLVRTFGFRLHDPKGRDFMPPGTIVVRREITFSDEQVLSKESEEALLWRDMQADLVQQLLRRLAAAKTRPLDGQ
ncbi:MAG: LPS assembly lipoprotein LptE [Candidatus Nitricoxidivorans perseverans]|uniref:LPS-assembly lipoprotein LptE n=1 Tax=Candidatus Nitricoxidivorans perseverans TaxID=2975601 RepID=A0AA49FJ72_9PROT|nr:MAG: LPS assembly lipoprotein LptE [Candidatus Nitricoxidivorans perseverans]